jgi:hypothetical protein
MASNLSTRKRYLEQILLGAERQKSNAEGILASAVELKAVESLRDSWNGFDSPPPYSILMLDELLNRREAVAEKAASHQSSIDILKSNLEILLAQWKEAGEAINQALTAYQKVVGDKEPRLSSRISSPGSSSFLKGKSVSVTLSWKGNWRLENSILGIATQLLAPGLPFTLWMGGSELASR